MNTFIYGNIISPFWMSSFIVWCDIRWSEDDLLYFYVSIFDVTFRDNKIMTTKRWWITFFEIIIDEKNMLDIVIKYVSETHSF